MPILALNALSTEPIERLSTTSTTPPRSSKSRAPPTSSVVDASATAAAVLPISWTSPTKSSQSTLPFQSIHLASFVLLVFAVLIQFLLPQLGPGQVTLSNDWKSSTSVRQASFPTEAPVCLNHNVFVVQPAQSRVSKMALLQRARKIAAEFDYDAEALRKSVVEFIREMDEGLQKPNATMSQIPTYVTAVPNGTEKGLFLAIDLGGTNFRVCSIRLHGNTTFTLTQSKVAIPKELMVAKTSKELFSFLAKQIETFLKTHHNEHFEAHVRRRLTMSAEEGYRDENVFRLGFTFSFPVEQIGINRGRLIRWTKGFDIDDAIGKDLCVLLQEEIDALKLPVRVAALVNDTVGTLMARSYTSPGKTGTVLGAIFGTGTNGAYVEKLDKITKLASMSEGDYDKDTGEMIVNTEWGSFDNELRTLPRTPYDEALDKESVNPGIQMFEKRVSGMFLGEILRRAILALAEDKDAPIFADSDSSSNDVHSTTTIADNSALYQQWGIDTSILSIVQGDHSAGFRLTRQALDRDLGVSAASIEDAEAVKILVEAIGRRSARLSAVAIGAVIVATGRLTATQSNRGPSIATTSAGQPKSSDEILQDVKALNLPAAASATAEKLEAAAAPLVDATPVPAVPGSKHDPNQGVAEEDIVDIGVDGSLVEYYPGFEEYIREALREIPEIGVQGERRIRIGIAKDGSGVGAALIALVAGNAGPPTDDGFLKGQGRGDEGEHLSAVTSRESGAS